MKQVFVKQFQLVKKGRAPRIQSRRFCIGEKSGNISYLSDAEKAEEEARTELLNKIQGIVSKELATRATVKELEDLKLSQIEAFKGISMDALRSIADEKTGVMAILSKQGIEIQRLTASSKEDKPDMSVRGQIASWRDANKDAIEQIRLGNKAELKPLEIRAAASPMSVATVDAGNSPFIGRTQVESGINDFIRTVPTFYDSLIKGRTNAQTYVWVNKTNAQGAAAFIGPGVLKPGVSISLEADNSVAKKIADSAKTTTELLQDIDGMQSFINEELRYQLMIKVNSTLMDSVGSSTIPTGVKQLSVAFTAATIKTTDPKFVDAIRAVVGQLRSGLLQGEITVFINPLDAVNMDLAKATLSGVYLLPPFSTMDSRMIGGARVIEDYNIPQGTIQAGFMKFYRILIYKDFTVTFGWENDDFTRNLVTAVGEMRIHQFFNQIHTGAFVRDTFANVIAAITQA